MSIKIETGLCPNCKIATTEPGKTSMDFEEEGIRITVIDIPAEVCPNCEAVYFPPGVADQVIKAVKELLAAAKQARHDAPDVQEYKVAMV